MGIHAKRRSAQWHTATINRLLDSGLEFSSLPFSLQMQHLSRAPAPVGTLALTHLTRGADLDSLLKQSLAHISRRNFLSVIGVVAWLRVALGTEDALPRDLEMAWSSLKCGPRECRESAQTCAGAMHMVGRFDLAEAIEVAAKLRLDQLLDRAPGLRSETLYFSAIGHIALLDYLLKAVDLGVIRRDAVQLLLGANPIANVEFAALLAERVDALGVSRGRWRAVPPQWQEPDLELWPLAEGGYGIARHAYGSVEAEWHSQGRPAQVTLPDDTRMRAEQTLLTRGLSAEDWFVGLHLRSGSDASRTLRNSRLRTLSQAIATIAEWGGRTVLVGDFAGEIPPELRQAVIDTRDLDAEERDAIHCYVWSEARFFMGNLSGGTFPPGVFGTPTLWFDTYPVAHIRPPGMRDLMVPKMVALRSSGRFLRLEEILSPAHSRSQVESPQLAEEYGYQVRDTTPDEINGAVVDMLTMTQEGPLPSHRHDEFIDAAFAQVGLDQGARIAPSFLDAWGSAIL
jgi:putative glycosyltransferase (TIGR04372 family)